MYTHLCQASQQGGWRRPEASRPLAEPKLAKFLGLFCSPHCISQDSPRNRTKSFSLPLFSQGGTGASVTLPLITRPPPASWPVAPHPSGEAQTQQVSGGIAVWRGWRCVGQCWPSLGLGALVGFHRQPPRWDPPITISRTGPSPSLTGSLHLQLTPVGFHPEPCAIQRSNGLLIGHINPLRGLWRQSPY